MEAVRELFDAGDFVPRTNCGMWTEFHSQLAQASELMIAVAYIGIPVCLVVLWLSRRRVDRHLWIILWFVAFIFLCGLTHVCQFLAFHWPAYRLFTLVAFVTALVSDGTAVVLPFVVYSILRSPTVSDALDEATRGTAVLRESLAAANARLAGLEATLVAEREKSGHLLKTLDEAYQAASEESRKKLREAAAMIGHTIRDGTVDPGPPC